MVLFPAEKVLALAEEQCMVFKWLLHSAEPEHNLFGCKLILSSIHEKEQKTIYVLLELAARQNEYCRCDREY